MNDRKHALFMSIVDIDAKLGELQARYAGGFMRSEDFLAETDSLLDLRIVLARNRLLYGSE